MFLCGHPVPENWSCCSGVGKTGLSITGVLVPLTGPVRHTTGSPGVVPFVPGELHASGRMGPVLQDRGSSKGAPWMQGLCTLIRFPSPVRLLCGPVRGPEAVFFDFIPQQARRRT